MYRGPHLLRRVEFRLHKLWREPRKGSEQVVSHQDLAVTIRSRADADGRDGTLPRHLAGDRWGDQFQHDGKRACSCQGFRIREEGLVFRFGPSLHMIAAFLAHALWQHSEMAAKGYSRG